MTPEQWQHVRDVLAEALERKAEDRPAFLDGACSWDPWLREEVELLLSSAEEARSFLESPALRSTALIPEDEVDVLVGGGMGQTQSLLGKQVDPYRILSLLGAGGMGQVYLAEDPRLGRMVALKILPAELASDPDRLRRFVREAKAASSLKHPNVAAIYEMGESNGLHFIAMEHVEGQTLASKISGRPLEIAAIVEIALQVADALDEAHGKHITHRDIKPANIMLTPSGQVKVLDFGLAKITLPEGQAAQSDLSTSLSTATGLIMGTLPYMSPEQVLGKTIDHRTDIFSLGVVLYEMSTGRVPFPGISASETTDCILHRQPEAIARFNHKVPAELERIVRKCLEKDRERRYQSAHELLIGLKNFQGQAA